MGSGFRISALLLLEAKRPEIKIGKLLYIIRETNTERERMTLLKLK